MLVRHRAIASLAFIALSFMSISAAQAVVVTTTCGVPVGNSVIRSDSAFRQTSATVFATLPGASVAFSVAEGSSRCVKVLFTAETSCSQTGNADFCFVRATDNGVALSPGGTQQKIDSESNAAAGHAFEWVGRVGPGNHVISLQWAVGNSATIFTVDDWTFDVELRL